MYKRFIKSWIAIGFIIFILLVSLYKIIINNPKETLKNVIYNSLLGTKGTYGIVIKNLKTGQTYYYNEHRVFDTGSLYKIWVMSSTFSQIEKGKLKESEVLSQEIAILNDKFDIDSEDAELTTGTISLSVLSAIKQMITISHNYAALLLTEKIKVSTIKSFLTQNNFKESSVGQPPKTTAYDIALFFEKLYKGELGSKENTNKMLSILKAQQLNDGLPKYLPKSVQIAHKTGDIGWFKHDAGIVFLPQKDSKANDYIIVVLSESNSPIGAQDRIAKVSKAVYDYFLEN